jgi:hypothetical protein
MPLNSALIDGNRPALWPDLRLGRVAFFRRALHLPVAEKMFLTGLAATKESGLLLKITDLSPKNKENSQW